MRHQLPRTSPALRQTPRPTRAPCRLSASPVLEIETQSPARHRSGGDLMLDAGKEVARCEPVGQGNRVANRLGRRPAVADDREAGDAEQRRAAVLGIVDAAAEPPERPSRQQVADLAGKGPLQLVAKQRFHGLYQSLARLQYHVAGEPVADDDVRRSAVDFTTLDVADEIERRRLEQP